jgi:hypothetical protein
MAPKPSQPWLSQVQWRNLRWVWTNSMQRSDASKIDASNLAKIFRESIRTSQFWLKSAKHIRHIWYILISFGPGFRWSRSIVSTFFQGVVRQSNVFFPCRSLGSADSSSTARVFGLLGLFFWWKAHEINHETVEKWGPNLCLEMQWREQWNLGWTGVFGKKNPGNSNISRYLTMDVPMLKHVGPSMMQLGAWHLTTCTSYLSSW